MAEAREKRMKLVKSLEVYAYEWHTIVFTLISSPKHSCSFSSYLLLGNNPKLSGIKQLSCSLRVCWLNIWKKPSTDGPSLLCAVWTSPEMTGMADDLNSWAGEPLS